MGKREEKDEQTDLETFFIKFGILFSLSWSYVAMATIKCSRGG